MNEKNNEKPLPTAPVNSQLSVTTYDFGPLDNQRGAIVLVQLPGLIESGIYIPFKSLPDVAKALLAAHAQLSSGLVLASSIPSGNDIKR